MTQILGNWKGRIRTWYNRLFKGHLWKTGEELQEHPERFESVTINGEEYIRRKKSAK